MKKYFLTVSILLFLLGGILLYQDITFNDKKLHIVICDVGQGDAILIRTPSGSDILIDGGPDSSVLSCLSRHLPFWDRTIEIMILTHPHADHLTGLIDVLKRYRVLSFGTEKIGSATDAYGELIKQLEQNLTKLRFLYQGDRFVIKDGVVLSVLWPTHEWINQNVLNKTNSDENGLSVIDLLSYKNFKALFTGDAQASDVARIDLIAGEISLLKVPHHGSKTGLTAEILDILNPKIAAISVGKNNKYGHPTPLILDLLKNLNIKTLRTDQIGDIEIISDGNNISIKN
jgi:competence protein ComEC